MKDRTITIRNIYVMMAYAFRSVEKAGEADIKTEDFDHLHDLFAELLVQGFSAQVKRGLHHDYRRHTEKLLTVRGQIDVTRTALTSATTPGSVICSYDEYELDNPFNRALKAVLILLIRHGEVTKGRRDSLRRLLPHLDQVKLVSPRSIKWNTFTYHRTNVSYRFLLGICQLVAEGLLPTEETGDSTLSSWLSNEAMSTLYERFLREYYAFHHPELSPGARKVDWHYDPASASGTHQLPAMRTDVTLKAGDRTLIIDAKYYGSSMQVSQFGKLSVHSAHLYQVLAYVLNADVDKAGIVSGLLLYARTDASAQPDLDVTIHGHRIGALSLDLNKPWEELQEDLESILSWIEDPVSPGEISLRKHSLTST